MKGFSLFKALVFFLLLHIVAGKECTNTPTQSHTFRYELFSSKNQTWKDEVSAHYHLTPTDDLAWADLLPRKMLKEEDEVSWAMEYRKIKNSGGFQAPGNFLQEISLHDVRLDPMSVQGRAQQTNLEYLLMLDPDSLVWSFRKTAGLPTPGTPYGGWEAPDVELRGHFVGHYLSASAQMWASTHNDTLNKKMSAVMAALSTCQEKMGSGYLSAFPSELFDRFEAVQYVWAPYYTIHKIFAGLLDQYTYAGNDHALKMATWMAQYFYNRVQNVIKKYTIERQWQSLNEETGGMNDVLYRLFTLTGDPKHLLLARLFDKPCFLGLLALEADDISGFHANTHIPIIIGSQMRYEITGDPLYKEISTFFMETVNSSHSYATGGTSYNEFWRDPKRLASTLQTENEESCTTYNMLKVSRNLFRWTKEAAYADYYERALTNGVLGIQRGTEPGIMIYMLPLGPGSSKGKSYHGWGTKFDSFWCCYGTGVESFSKLGDSLYFEDKGDNPSLYIIQYVSSSVDWKSGQISLNQKVDPVVSWDPYMRATFTFSSKEGASKSSALNLRVPIWTSNGAEAKLNSETLPLPAPGSFLPVNRSWSPTDKLTLQLPLSLRTEAIKDDRPEYGSFQAILYGPYLLAGYSNGDLDIKTGSVNSLSDWITPIPRHYNDYLVTFFQQSGNSTFVLANSDQSIKMEKHSESGTDAAVHATFRVILSEKPSNFSSLSDLIGQSVILEPFDFPGKVLLQESDGGISVGESPADGDSSSFQLVSGLDGKDGTVSLESQSQKDCFVYSGVDYEAGAGLSLRCKDKKGGGFKNQAASFAMKKGLVDYHPISFTAKGAKRNFVLSPLMSFRDEAYTVYFSIYP